MRLRQPFLSSTLRPPRKRIDYLNRPENVSFKAICITSPHAKVFNEDEMFSVVINIYVRVFQLKASPLIQIY